MSEGQEREMERIDELRHKCLNQLARSYVLVEGSLKCCENEADPAKRRELLNKTLAAYGEVIIAAQYMDQTMMLRYGERLGIICRYTKNFDRRVQYQVNQTILELYGNHYITQLGIPVRDMLTGKCYLCPQEITDEFEKPQYFASKAFTSAKKFHPGRRNSRIMGREWQALCMELAIAKGKEEYFEKFK